MSRSTPTGGDTCGSPVASITSPTLSTISRGSSGLPVACAGHTDVQRPQIVHASVSKSCFQVKSSTVDAPNVSSSVSIRLGSGFIAPFGRSLSLRYMFIGDVIMWRSFVVGRITTNATNAAKCTIHIVVCRSAYVLRDQPKSSNSCAERVADERPPLERRRRLLREAERLGEEAGDADHEERREDDRVLGLGLDADAVRPLDVAPDRSPRGCRRRTRRRRCRPSPSTPGTRRRAGT